MKRNIYDILNNATIDIKKLDRENFNDLEKKTFIKNFKKSINKNKSKKRKTALAASFAAFIVLGVGLSSEVLADIKLKIFDIGYYLSINKNLDDYKTIINSSVTKNAITIQLNDVIIDNDEVIVSSTIKSDFKLDEMGLSPLSDLYINGKIVSYGSGGTGKVVDDYTYENIAIYYLDRELPLENLNIKIKHDSVLSKGEEIKGPWNFEFTANGEQLSIDTYESKINYDFMLDNNQKITLNKYTSNNIGQKIYYSVENKTENYQLELRGMDDLGNEVIFSAIYGDKNGGVYKQDTMISDEAKVLTLTPYAVPFPKESGEASKDYKKVGEEFTININ